MRRGKTIRIGCSGYEYKGWIGRFYPDGLRAAQRFDHYAATFDTVEINNSFYRLPSETAVAAWRERSPASFLFAMKASRFLTHMKKLNDPDEPIDRMFKVFRVLGPKLGPVLYQLPPRWRINVERLATFLGKLPTDVEHAIEFRDPSWYDAEVYALLEQHGVAMCVHDMTGAESPRMSLGPLVYLRFHGTEGKYRGGYPARALRNWAAWMREHAVEERKPLYAYFNNDVNCQAPYDAQTLRKLLLEPRAVTEQRPTP